MPAVKYEELGTVTVYDGKNVAELAELTGTDPAPEPDEDGAVVLMVPQPAPASPAEARLLPGDGLVHRVPTGFMLFGADALATYTVVTP